MKKLLLVSVNSILKCLSIEGSTWQKINTIAYLWKHWRLSTSTAQTDIWTFVPNQTTLRRRYSNVNSRRRLLSSDMSKCPSRISRWGVLTKFEQEHRWRLSNANATGLFFCCFFHKLSWWWRWKFMIHSFWLKSILYQNRKTELNFYNWDDIK